jgi:amino acid permease
MISLLNAVAVGIFGEAEFWLSGGKVVLMFMLFSFTFITMIGGNPQDDVYGFRYWSNPGAFASFSSTGALGKFEGFLGALVTAVFIIVGPDYISMIAAEAKHPSIYLKTAFKTVYLRFGIFFIGSALAVGIILPYNDPELRRIHIAGGAIINYIVISITFIRYYHACKVQGLDRKTLPYYGYFQPYGAYISLFFIVLVGYSYGYRAFSPWNTESFFANYTMQITAPVLYVFWKALKKTKVKKSLEIDLVWERPSIDLYEAQALINEPPSTFWGEMGQITGLGYITKYIRQMIFKQSPS